jgi:preprotein translocase, yajC subunit
LNIHNSKLFITFAENNKNKNKYKYSISIMLSTILLQAQTQGAGGSMWSTILMFALLIVVFYFFLIRPQSKRQKEVRKFQDSLENGKSVITQGGIYGKIKEVKDNYVILEIAEGIKIKVNKNMLFDATDPSSATSNETAK